MQTVTAAQAVEPTPFLWTREQFYQLLDMDFFLDRRVQLIEGEIVEMSAQRKPHAVAISLTEGSLRAAFGPGFWVRTQMSLHLTPFSVPDPDVAVVPGTPRQYATGGNPTTALLIVEVSLTTVSFDRLRKGSLYARAGIADYWLVNSVDGQVEVYRNPVADSSARYRFRYADVTIHQPNDVISPLPAPGARVAGADLLP